MTYAPGRGQNTLLHWTIVANVYMVELKNWMTGKGPLPSARKQLPPWPPLFITHCSPGPVAPCPMDQSPHGTACPVCIVL